MTDLVARLRELRGKITPGPWIADEFCEDNDEAKRVGTYDGTPTYYHRTTTIAFCQTNYGDDLDEAGPEIGIVAAEANAKLIALAPEMADALEQSTLEIKELREALEFYADPGNWYGAYVVGNSSPMADDWSDDFDDPSFPDGKPGKRARAALNHHEGSEG